MHLILWRHAEAEDGLPDMERQLTRKGERQARRMAEWLNLRLPANFQVISSPAERALQTASALTDKFEIVDSIAPGASAAAVIKATGWPAARRMVVLVGHQPTLGEAAAHLLTGKPAPWSVKKGSIWWLSYRSREGMAQVVLRAVMSPDLLQ